MWNEYISSIGRRILILPFFLLSLHLSGQGYQIQNTFKESSAAITAITKNKVLDRLVYGNEKGNIFIRKLSDATLLDTLTIHGNAVNTINFNSTGKLMISSTVDGEIKIYDFDKEKIIQGIYSPDYNGIRFVLFSIADGFIYFNSKNKLYKTRSDLSQSVNLVSEFEDSLFTAVITTDRNSLILATGNKLLVMNTRSDQLRQEITAGNSNIEYLTLLGDTLLASWSNDGIIRFWPYKVGQLAISPSHWFKAGSPALMNFSSDASLMVSGNTGNWARVWNPFNKVIKQELFGHKGKVNCSVFGEDEKSLFTASADNSVIQWTYSELPPIQTLIPAPTQSIPAVLQKPLAIAEIKDSIISVPDVIMTVENTPIMIQGRNVIGTEQVEVSSPSLTIFVYDNSYVDGDTMSLYFNGKWILDHYGVTKKKMPVDLQFKANTNNFLVLFANNLGKSPPNTAAVEINDGQRKRIFRLSSDLKSCSAINFIYKPEN
ncbi:MAG: hypothetical protein EYC69_01765 [Bacteroidetes bacterium]|nr:MAG: hypothetical protein EYC69_01765 [Bacteroidota bacterium]